MGRKKLCRGYPTPHKLLKSVLVLALLTAPLSAKALTDNSATDDDGEQYVPIPELNYHNNQDNDVSVFDEVRVHLGAAFLDSFQNLEIAPGERAQGSLRGIQLGLGVDLFSEHWICEGDLVSLAGSNVGDAQVSTNGFELRLLYETPVADSVTIHMGAGVASRNYDVKTASDEQTFASGATVLVGGADYWVNDSFSTGLELADHMPMASGDDPSSIDLAVRLNGHF